MAAAVEPMYAHLNRVLSDGRQQQRATANDDHNTSSSVDGSTSASSDAFGESLRTSLDASVFDVQLAAEPWIWCGPDVGFKAVHEVALDCDVALSPHFCALPTALSPLHEVSSVTVRTATESLHGGIGMFVG